MTSHTPGPWQLVHDHYLEGGLGLVGYTEVMVGGEREVGVTIYNTTRPERMANAQLIAASPDMLEALKAIADWDKVPLTHEHPGALIDVIRCICDRARAEIAKASAVASAEPRGDHG